MFTKLMIGLLIFALLGGVGSAMSILPGRSKKIIVPIKEQKTERTIRCKEGLELNDKGRVIACTSGFYLDEESENREERKGTMKEKFLGWLDNFRGLFFWAVLGSIGASFLGFGGLVSTLWGNLFGATAKALKATLRGISNFKKNGRVLKGKEKEEYDEHVKELVREVQSEQRKSGVEKKVNEVRAKIE